jgi:glycogen debranching enzyme
MTFLYREYQAYAHFNQEWAQQLENGEMNDEVRQVLIQYRAEAERSRTAADDIKKSLNDMLWNESLGYYTAYNLSRAAHDPHPVTNRVGLMGFPLWAGLASTEQAARLVKELWKEDMLSDWGIRSVSNKDPRYTNANIIKPYSNWAGPIWVNANAMISYGLLRYNYTKEAKLLADRVVGALGADLDKSKTWHECYSADDGSALAAPGFLSWDTLGCQWQAQLAKGEDPFAL